MVFGPEVWHPTRPDKPSTETRSRLKPDDLVFIAVPFCTVDGGQHIKYVARPRLCFGHPAPPQFQHEQRVKTLRMVLPLVQMLGVHFLDYSAIEINRRERLAGKEQIVQHRPQ